MRNKLDQLHLMRLFVAIIQTGTFSAAAKQLGIAATKASKDIRYLETNLATTLLNRTTRAVHLTDQGELFYQSSMDILERYDQLLDRLQTMKDTLSGELRIAAPSLWGKVLLTPLILAFKKQYPEVKLLADFSNEPCDLFRDNIHIAFRSTELKNEPYLARYICRDEFVLCASKFYLEHAAHIHTLDDLAKHKMITLAERHSQFDHLTFIHQDQEINQHISGDLSFNNKESIYSAVQQDFGLAVLPRYLVNEDLQAGKLAQVLTDFQVKPSAFYALYTQRRKESALVNSFIDFVAQQLKDD